MLSPSFNKALQEIAKREIDTVVKKLARHYKFDYNDAMKIICDGQEVQKHGFIWEKELITNVYGATENELKEIKYTNKMDLPAKLNRVGNYDLSVKTCGVKNAVCMADCLRIFDSVNSENPFHMTTIFYKQNDETKTKKVYRIVEVDLTNSKDELFGELEREDIEHLDKTVKSVPQKERPTEEQHKKMYAVRDALSIKGGALLLNIKCNSTQSRLQCSFNKFDLFLKQSPERVVDISMTHHFKDGEISAEIASGRRNSSYKSINY